MSAPETYISGRGMLISGRGMLISAPEILVSAAEMKIAGAEMKNILQWEDRKTGRANPEMPPANFLSARMRIFR